jgi:hypothetical protein
MDGAGVAKGVCNAMDGQSPGEYHIWRTATMVPVGAMGWRWHNTAEGAVVGMLPPRPPWLFGQGVLRRI